MILAYAAVLRKNYASNYIQGFAMKTIYLVSIYQCALARIVSNIEFGKGFCLMKTSVTFQLNQCSPVIKNVTL